MYIFRGVPSNLTENFATTTDQQLVHQVLKLIGKNPPPTASDALHVSQRILLPTKFGGLGFPSYTSIRHAAYVSATVISAPSINADLPNLSRTQKLSFLNHLPGFPSAITTISNICTSITGSVHNLAYHHMMHSD
jgi:hypothetical protein